MIFTQKFDMYGQKFNVKMLPQGEVEQLGDITEDKIKELIVSIVLDDNNKPIFKNADDVKKSLPPKVINEIINLSAGVEKKSI